MTKPAVTNRDIRDDLRKLADNDASAAADRASIKGALNSIRSVQDAQHEVQDAQYESVAADFVDTRQRQAHTHRWMIAGFAVTWLLLILDAWLG